MTETYEQWEARRRYSVIHNQRPNSQSIETVVASGLTWDAATAKRKQLQDAEKLANPGKSSWTIDIFTIQLETPWVPVNQQQQTKGENTK
jgi:hypothetical protein